MIRRISLDQASLLSSAWKWNRQSGSNISCQVLCLQDLGTYQQFGYVEREQLLDCIISTVISGDCSNILRDCLLVMMMEHVQEFFRTGLQVHNHISRLISSMSSFQHDTIIWSSLAYTCTNILVCMTNSLPRTCHNLIATLTNQLSSFPSTVSQRCLLQIRSIECQAFSREGEQCQCPMLIPSLYSNRPYSALSSLHCLMLSECANIHRVNLQQTALELYQTRYSPVYALMAYIILNHDADNHHDEFSSYLQLSASDLTQPLTIHWLFISWIKGKHFLAWLQRTTFDRSPYILITKLQLLLLHYNECCFNNLVQLLTYLCESLPNSSLSNILSRLPLPDSLLMSLPVNALVQLSLSSNLANRTLPYLLHKMSLVDNPLTILTAADYLAVLLAAAKCPDADTSILLKLCQISLPMAMESFQFGYKLISALNIVSKSDVKQTSYLLTDIARHHPHIHIRDRATILLNFMQPEIRKSGNQMADSKEKDQIELP